MESPPSSAPRSKFWNFPSVFQTGIKRPTEEFSAERVSLGSCGCQLWGAVGQSFLFTGKDPELPELCSPCSDSSRLGLHRGSLVGLVMGTRRRLSWSRKPCRGCRVPPPPPPLAQTYLVWNGSGDPGEQPSQWDLQPLWFGARSEPRGKPLLPAP